MGLDKKSASHICNVIRRSIQSKYRDFTPFFVILDKDVKVSALERDASLILRHPAGQVFLDYLRNIEKKNAEEKRTRFVGLCDFSRRLPFGVFDTHNVLAVFYINIDHFETEFALRSHALHMIWHALALRADYMQRESRLPKALDKPNFFQEETYDILAGVIRPKLSTGKAFQRNLMADIFAAALQHLEGDPTAVRGVAAMRMRETLIPKEGFIAERYPYAVCHDTLEFMFENDKLINRKKSGALGQAMKIAEEIGNRYSIPSTEQWKNFSHPAQHMAWVGYPPEVTLGAAIYSSENPYVRSIGDIVVDFTHIEPEIVTTMDSFNPFAGREKGIALHKKYCMDILRRLLMDYAMSERVQCFYEEARRQEEKLRTGNPFGWCAHALIKLADTIKDEFVGGFDDKNKTTAESIFQTALDEIPYETVLKFSSAIFQRRRNGAEIHEAEILRLAGMSSDFVMIKETIERARALTPQFLQQQNAA